MRKLKKIRNVLKRIIVCVFVVILMAMLPHVKLHSDDNFERIYNAFLGNKSKYQGIIEIWNIDTFEGGLESKTSILNKIAKGFQKKNKGVYIMVRNISEQECLNLLKSGEKPDLFSCSYGVAKQIEGYIEAFSNIDMSNIEENAKNAGLKNNLSFGVAWCKGSYYLISTRERLEKAKVENIENIKLSNILFSTGYSFKNKKGEGVVYSLSFGSSKYLLPQEILKAYNKSEVNLISNLSFNKELISQTGYSAYCEFIAGKSNILLGTQRDVFRLENRVKLGKVSDVIYEQVITFNDLIQFMFLTKNSDIEKREVIEKFVEYLISEKSQSVVCESGLFSINLGFSMSNDSIMQNITPQNFSNYKANNVFIDENEIKKLQQI